MVAAAAAVAILAACSGKATRRAETGMATAAAPTYGDEPAVGEWLRAGAHGPTGVRLAPDGTAEVVNRRGPHYESWTRTADTVRIDGHNGHGRVSDTYVLDGDTLTLWLGGQPALKYVRRNAKP